MHPVDDWFSLPISFTEAALCVYHNHTPAPLSRLAFSPSFQPTGTLGAVQGSGVMIVVAEDTYAGTLAVRQVSEVSFLG